MRAHDDEVGFDRLSRPQNAVERIAIDHHRSALSNVQLRYGANLFCEDSLSLTLLDLSEAFREIVVYDVDECELACSGLNQETCSSQCAMRPRRKVRRCEDLHLIHLHLKKLLLICSLQCAISRRLAN
jgi:hypothetical protein